MPKSSFYALTVVSNNLGGVTGFGEYTRMVTKDAVVSLDAVVRVTSTQAVYDSIVFWLLGVAGDEMYIKDVAITPLGSTLALEPECVGANQWIDASGNGHHAIYPSGAALVRPAQISRYIWSTPITGDTALTNIVPAGYELDRLLLHNSTANPVDIQLGTTAGASDVLDSTTVASGYTSISVNRAWSLASATTLYLSSEIWTAASLTFTAYFRSII